MVTERKDGEKLSWVIAEIIFIGVYFFIDGWYTSYPVMPDALKVVVWIGRLALAACVIVTWVNFKNPNYEIYRKFTVAIALILSLVIGVHHASEKDTNQVIIDSKENAAK